MDLFVLDLKVLLIRESWVVFFALVMFMLLVVFINIGSVCGIFCLSVRIKIGCSRIACSVVKNVMWMSVRNL